MKHKRIAFVSTLGLLLHSTGCEEKPVDPDKKNPVVETNSISEPPPPETKEPDPLKQDDKVLPQKETKETKGKEKEEKKTDKEKPDFKNYPTFNPPPIPPPPSQKKEEKEEKKE